MTAAELIEYLRRFPPNTPVLKKAVAGALEEFRPVYAVSNYVRAGENDKYFKTRNWRKNTIQVVTIG